MKLVTNVVAGASDGAQRRSVTGSFDAPLP